ncbi:MAG: questin oxidase family protein [Rubrivivax sp.]
MDAALLHALLDEAAAWDPEYGGGLSSHLPMALVALARLGAGEARLHEFSARYAAYKQLVPARPRGEWPAGDAWRGRLGRRAAWPLYLDLFRQWIAHDGASEALSQLLPGLMPGVGAAAFHGLIRTAAGVRAGHAGEVAQGLAHWAAWYLPLGTMVPLAEASGRPQADPVRLLRQLHAGATGTGLIRTA